MHPWVRTISDDSSEDEHGISCDSHTPFLRALVRFTGVDLSKILGGKPESWGKMVSITDEYMGVSQLLGARARAAPKSTPMVRFTHTCTMYKRQMPLPARESGWVRVSVNVRKAYSKRPNI